MEALHNGTPKARLLVVDDHAFMRVAVKAIELGLYSE